MLLLAITKPLFSLHIFAFHSLSRLTVCITRWWAGRDDTVLPEPASSHAKCLKTRRLPPPWSRCSSEGRVHAVLGGNRLPIDESVKETAWITFSQQAVNFKDAGKCTFLAPQVAEILLVPAIDGRIDR